MDDENVLLMAMLIKVRNGEPISTSDMRRYTDFITTKLPRFDIGDMPTWAGLQTQYRSNLQAILTQGQQKPG